MVPGGMTASGFRLGLSLWRSVQRSVVPRWRRARVLNVSPDPLTRNSITGPGLGASGGSPGAADSTLPADMGRRFGSAIGGGAGGVVSWGRDAGEGATGGGGGGAGGGGNEAGALGTVPEAGIRMGRVSLP